MRPSWRPRRAPLTPRRWTRTLVQRRAVLELAQRAHRVVNLGVGMPAAVGAKALVFVGTLTAGGLQVQAGDGRLRIVREGRVRKLVPAVSHLSYNAAYMALRGQPVRYVTERAVFELRPGADGAPQLTLIEIATGLELQRDVLDACAAPVAVAAELRTMDERIFRSGPLRL